MLRALVLVLALANLGFYAWSEGWLDGAVGVRARGDREPERLARQVHPELVRILPPAAASAAASSAASAPPAALACLEAGPFGGSDVGAAELALQAALPSGRWTDVPADKPGSWMVYMGKYPNRDTLAKKEDELKRRKVDFDEVTTPAEFELGLSLGRFDERAAADATLAQLAQQGIHTARIVELKPATRGHLLRVDQADPALAGKLAALKSDALGRGFVPCAVAAR
ncbi:MAG: SPOR domain-containing protein [Proteobacteria bacterium]|nr:SPOR domain-containing protein [Pseudomonadota bacterium]